MKITTGKHIFTYTWFPTKSLSPLLHLLLSLLFISTELQ